MTVPSVVAGPNAGSRFQFAIGLNETDAGGGVGVAELESVELPPELLGKSSGGRPGSRAG